MWMKMMEMKLRTMSLTTVECNNHQIFGGEAVKFLRGFKGEQMVSTMINS